MQKLNSPGLVPSSQEAGGCVHDQSLTQTAPGSAPGYDGGTMNYPVSTDAPVPAMPAAIPVSDEAGRVRGNDGRFTESGPWKQATSSAGGWKQL